MFNRVSARIGSSKYKLQWFGQARKSLTFSQFGNLRLFPVLVKDYLDTLL